MTGLVNNIQKYSVHDGGGIRTVVCLQGCPLRCRWCSNPETQPLANPRLYWRNKCIGCGRCVEVCPRHIGCRDLHSPDCRMCLACVENCCTGALTESGRWKYFWVTLPSPVEGSRVIMLSAGYSCRELASEEYFTGISASVRSVSSAA